MKYFTKYLPVEGEIKEGDWITSHDGIYKCTKIFTYSDRPGIFVRCSGFQGTTNIERWKKAKLFLCSRDIQVGDKGYSTQYKPETERLVISKGEWMNPIYEGIPTMDEGTEGFKAIGEISPDANWVTEGMEFEEEDILFSSRDVTDDTQTVVHIQCPACKHYH